MKITALLTGRGNNTLRDKNILPVLGKPLLYYPGMAAKYSKYVNSLFVSSDDIKILNAASEFGYKKILRPVRLSMPDSQHIDVILHALDFIEKEDGFRPDIIVVLLANSGIIKTEWVNDCISEIINNPETSSVVPVYIEQDNHPFRAKKMKENGYLDTFFDFSGQKISTNRQDLPTCYFLCHNFWVLNVAKSIDLLPDGQQPWTFMGNNIKPYVVDMSFDVHTEEDIIKTEKWLVQEGISY
jgi:CMP-N,N'-diacetyllegionaminic acid synthase